MSFAYLKGDVQSPTGDRLICTIGLEGSQTYTKEGVLVIPPGLHRFVGHCNLVVPTGAFTVVLRTGRVSLRTKVTFEDAKTYTLEELFKDNGLTPSPSTPLTVQVESDTSPVRRD